MHTGTDRQSRDRDSVPCVSVPKKRTNIIAKYPKYIISIFTRGILLLDDDLIGECNDLAGAALEQVFRPGETVGGFRFPGGESDSVVLFYNIITLSLKFAI